VVEDPSDWDHEWGTSKEVKSASAEIDRLSDEHGGKPLSEVELKESTPSVWLQTTRLARRLLKQQ